MATALRCGSAFIATVHAADIHDLQQRPIVRALLGTGAFGYIVFLDSRARAGRINRIYEWSG